MFVEHSRQSATYARTVLKRDPSGTLRQRLGPRQLDEHTQHRPTRFAQVTHLHELDTLCFTHGADEGFEGCAVDDSGHVALCRDTEARSGRKNRGIKTQEGGPTGP